MRDDHFEWDDEKAHINYSNHRLTFEFSRNAFLDANALDEFDHTDANGEDRFNWYGMIGRNVIVVTYCMRKHRRRIISARRASRHEQDAYFKREF
jgi:uncharacterized protein